MSAAKNEDGVMMLHNVPTLEQFMRLLQQVPYLASKNIYRVTSHFLHMDERRVEQFCAALLQLKKQVEYCQKCFFWKEKERQCIFCDSPKRNPALVCVVETWQAVIAIERAGGYDGMYHVLTGVICPLEGVGPDQLTLKQLVSRVQERTIKELVIALGQTPEGEATSAYIATMVKNIPIKLSSLARGVPVGSSLEAMDRLTVYKALSERRPL